jgi:lipooligosaccharide transport system ATP-binding protein
MNVITSRGLQKHYGSEPVVRDLDLDIARGECFGLLGPNGAGKTTTLRLLLGLSPPTGGTLEVLGYTIPAQAAAMRALAGVVPQQDNLDPDFSVRENLRVYGRYFGIPAALLESRIPSLLEFAALEKRADVPIATLSGGMRRRLTLARALVNAPELLFLDEPTTGLDPQARHLIWQRLRGLRNAGKTLILTTHYMDEAQRLCDRLAVMDQGRVLDSGSPAELIARHIEPEVVEVSGDAAATWLEQYGRSRSVRAELVGETVFCYARDARPLLEQLVAHRDLRYLHRPANLEDVFLKLTGRELRE